MPGRALDSTVTELLNALQSVKSGFSGFGIVLNTQIRRLQANPVRDEKQKNKLLLLQKTLDEKIEKLNRASKIYEGLSIMPTRHHGRYDSPMQAYRFNKAMSSFGKTKRQRRRDELLEMFDGNDILADEYLSAERSHEAEYIHKERGLRDRRIQDKKDREDREAIKHFRSSESIRRHRGAYDYMLDTMDDYDRKIHDLGKKYGGGSEGRRRADDVIRNNALKGLPKFMQKLLKNSSISTKTLGAMTHMMPRVFGILSNPIAMGAALGIGTWKLASGFSENADNANRSVVSWRNAANFFGTPSERFQKAAYLAGIKDPAKIAQMYGELTYNFGDAETAMESIGYSLKGKGTKERLFTAKSLGITPEILAMMDLYSGQIVPDEVRQMTAKRSMVGVTSKMMGTSDQAWWNKVASYAGNESIATRLGDVDFSDVRGGNKVSIILNGPVNVNADDAEAFADSVQKESSKNSGISALEEQDTREK